jgi:hypothetical protein
VLQEVSRTYLLVSGSEIVHKAVAGKFRVIDVRHRLHKYGVMLMVQETVVVDDIMICTSEIQTVVVH